MGHQPRPLAALLRARLRHLLHTLYPSFSVRRGIFLPLSLLSMAFVLLLIALGFYLVIPFTLLPQLHAEPLSSTLWLLLFSWSVSCTVLSYALLAVAEPGRVPPSWRARAWQHEPPGQPGVACDPADGNIYPVPPPEVQAANTAMLRSDRRYRFCVLCNVFKPDRAHHCSMCRECVLQMDHHCPFTGNSCIGVLNRKFFVLFLYYATISCALVVALTPRALLAHLARLDNSLTKLDFAWTVLLLVAYILCALHALALAPFSAFHTYLVLINRTTIENQELRHALHVKVLQHSDRGWLANWNATFGPRPWLWFVPVSYGRECDGLKWPSPARPAPPPDRPSVVVGDDAV